MSLDLSKFTADAAADEPMTATSRGRDVDYGPFPAWLTDSKANNTGKALVAANGEEARAIGNMVRRAARSLNIGCAVQYVIVGGPQDGQLINDVESVAKRDGKIKVRFIGKDLRAHDTNKPRKPTRKDAWTDAEYVTELRKYGATMTAYLMENGAANKVDAFTEKLNAEIVTLLPAPAKPAAAPAKPAAKPAAVKSA